MGISPWFTSWFIFFAFAWLAFAIIAQFAVSFFIAEDAERTKRKTVFWGVLTFFFSFIAIAIYYWTRQKNRELIEKARGARGKIVIWAVGLFLIYIAFFIIFSAKLMAIMTGSFKF